MLGGIVWGTVATGAAPVLGAPAQILNEAAKIDLICLLASAPCCSKRLHRLMYRWNVSPVFIEWPLSGDVDLPAKDTLQNLVIKLVWKRYSNLYEFIIIKLASPHYVASQGHTLAHHDYGFASEVR